MTIKKNVLYWVGRPEIGSIGRFGKRMTIYKTAIIDDSGEIIYGSQSYTSFGKKGVPNNVIKVTKSEFEKMIKNK